MGIYGFLGGVYGFWKCMRRIIHMIWVVIRIWYWRNPDLMCLRVNILLGKRLLVLVVAKIRLRCGSVLGI
jgi:hypothetical protein